MIKFKLALRSNADKPTGIRRIVTGFMALVMLFTATVLTSSTALAYDPIQLDMNGRKYFGASICVGSTLNSAYYPVAAIAQQWNNVANRIGETVLRLDYSTNCAADGYTARQTMTVGVFSNANYGSCIATTNTASFPYGDSNMQYWQHGPGVYINVGIPSCVSTAQRRAHQVAAGIGYPLGLSFQTTSSWSNRVMCTCSTDTLRSPSYAEGDRVREIYDNVYGGTY